MFYFPEKIAPLYSEISEEELKRKIKEIKIKMHNAGLIGSPVIIMEKLFESDSLKMDWGDLKRIVKLRDSFNTGLKLLVDNNYVIYNKRNGNTITVI